MIGLNDIETGDYEAVTRRVSDDTPATILIADDDEDLRTILSSRIKGVGFNVLTAVNGQEAIEKVRDQDVSVVLLDVRMPKMSGFDVLERLKSNDSPPAVIFVSAQASLGDRLKALYGGAVDFIAKPFEPQELLARVAVAIRVKKQIDEARNEARIDPLTLLSNRRSFEKSLFAETARAARFRRPLALIIVHVEGLTDLNDAFGVTVGDDCLKAIARAIRLVCHDTDRPARVGGNDFGIIIPETGRDGAETTVAQLKAAVGEEQFSARGRPMTPAVAIGIAVFPDDAQDARSLHAEAIKAMKKAQ